MDKFEGNDLYSFDNSSNKIENGQETFDLNSFSSVNLESNSEKRGKSGKGKKKTKQRLLKIFLTLFLIGLSVFLITVTSVTVWVFTADDKEMEKFDLNNLESMDIGKQGLNFTTTIYVDDGNGGHSEYRRLHGEYNRIWVDYDEVAIKNNDPDYKGIPKMLANAFIAIEDKHFLDHNGVDWKRTVGAVINEFVPIYSSRQGGSTITQQLVKNLTGDNEQVMSRKVREIMRARYLESRYSKATILECYLNTIAMGNGIYGVEVAANYYFGKSVNELTILECASLASITKAPSYYAPDTNPEDNKTRRNAVLYEMKDQGFITEEEYNKAINAKLKVVADKRVLSQDSVNNYFVDALIEQVTDDLAKQYGYEKSKASEIFYTSGYKIYATVDPEMQSDAEKVFLDKSYAIKGKDNSTLQAGMVVMDYSGNVKALVGGLGKKTSDRGFNNATDAVRQPGSTMKPIAAYAPAVDQNLITYSTMLNDKRTNYNGWTPKNWYNSYWGKVTTQYALERSINSIPVYLVNKMTPQFSFDFLTQKLGVTTLNKEDINLSPLGMGGTNGGLTPLESAAAFAIFGNGGRYYEPTLYSKVLDQEGNVILEHKSAAKVAVSEDTATVMNHLLQTVVYGSNGTGRAAASYIKNMKIYAKTGTSNDQNDLWFVGGTPYYVASCWCGFKNPQPIPSSQSGIALKIWGNVMAEAHKGLPAKKFVDSSFAVKKRYCTATGNIATDGCPKTAVGWYRESNVPAKCTAHPAKKNDKTNTTTTNSQSSTSSAENPSQTTSSEATASSGTTAE